jgi:hypothetical protein
MPFQVTARRPVLSSIVAGEDVAEERVPCPAGHQLGDLPGQRGVVLGQEAVHLAARVGDDARGQALVVDAAHALEHVAERPVPEVVQQRRAEAHRLLALVDRERPAELLDDAPGRLHDAEAVAVAAVVGAGVGQVGHAELPDPAQALELCGVQEAEQQRVGRAVRAERDDVVHRVADDLLRHTHSSRPLSLPLLAAAVAAGRFLP